jgi:hypothetical protein
MMAIIIMIMNIGKDDNSNKASVAAADDKEAVTRSRRKLQRN